MTYIIANVKELVVHHRLGEGEESYPTSPKVEFHIANITL